MRFARLATAILIAGCAAPSCDSGAKSVATIRLATTTSARDTGLLDVLIPEFRRDTGIDVQAIAVGTGEALKYGERGDADVVLVHARKAEDAFLARGFGVERRDVWWNRFLIVGPEDASDNWDLWGAVYPVHYVPKDPTLALRAVNTPPAVAVLEVIRERGYLFASRGDDSGTHKRELELWGKGFLKWPGYIETGQGMGPTLTIADEKNAFTLTDEGTYLKMRKRLRLKVVVKDDPALVNPYGVILPKDRPPAARTFFEWLTGDRCRALVKDFRVDGERAFFLPGEKPD